VNELKAEIKEWKTKFRKYRHDKPQDPLCVQHAQLAKQGKLDKSRLDDLVLEFKEKQMKKSTEQTKRAHQQFQEEKGKELNSSIDYLTLCRANNLNPWGGDEVPMCSNRRWAARGEIARLDALVVA
jgi:hypothetical protein